MRFASILVALPLIGAAFAQSNHVVLVGANGTLTYSPSEIQVAAGDTVSFQFVSKNHTVTQSTFASPCSNMTGPDGSPGVDSGYQPVAPGATQFQQWTITINNATAPMWFYCRQGNHCAQGMVFAINPNTEKTFAAFQAAAKASGSGSGSPYGAGSATNGAPRPTSATVTSPTSPSASPTTDTSNIGSAAVSVRAGSAAGLLMACVGLAAGLML